MATERHQVTIDGRKLQLSNLGKVLYPKAGFTKGDVIDYYRQIAPVLLPHLKGRLLTMKRYPDGVEGEFFYQKRCPAHRPQWVHTADVWSEGNQADVTYCVIDDLPTLVWAANLADLELHTSLAKLPQLDRPTALVFDLDPGAPADIVDCCDVALLLREELADLRLECCAKTSGSKGLQVYAPLNTPKATFETTKRLAHELAREFAARHPDTVVSKQLKALRRGKVLVDWSQNDQNKTTVCAYSLRAREQPTVSTPVTWEEVERTARTRDAGSLRFDAHSVLERVERHGDLFAPLLEKRQRLPGPPPAAGAKPR